MSDPNPLSPVNSGMSDNVAGCLAYMTVIPAIIFLLVEPYNKKSFVRFHAWQCIFLALAWIVIDIAISILGLFGAYFLLIDIGLYSLVALAMIIVWIMAILKALNGERYKLPVVGGLAERFAGAA